MATTASASDSVSAALISRRLLRLTWPGSPPAAVSKKAATTSTLEVDQAGELDTRPSTVTSTGSSSGANAKAFLRSPARLGGLSVAVFVGRCPPVVAGSPGSVIVGCAELGRLVVGDEEGPVGDGRLVGAERSAPGSPADPSTPQAAASTSTIRPTQAQGRMFLLTQHHTPPVTG